MRIERFLIAVASAGVLGGCIEKSPVSPAAHALLVHGVLDASSRDQYVVVQATAGSPATTTPVSGAVVTLTLPDGRVLTAAEERDSTHAIAPFEEPRVSTLYHFSLDRLGFDVVPGATYQLRVVAPDGRIVTGHTTVPVAKAVTSADAPESFSLLRDTLRLAWQRVSVARSYEVSVVFSTITGTVFADTSIVLTGQSSTPLGDRLFPIVNNGPASRYQVVVSAVDSNYYDYFRRSSDFFTGVGVIGHLDGALGVFGAIVPIVRKTLDVR